MTDGKLRTGTVARRMAACGLPGLAGGADGDDRCRPDRVVEDGRNGDPDPRDRSVAVARRTIPRGEALFNGRPILIRA
jgi:hypothetical protein